jgi:GPH family glycoside/pentoside/hexuronide:cation symporter
MEKSTIATATVTPRAPSVRIDVFYAMVTMGSATIWGVIGGWLLYFYLPPEGEGRVLVPAAFYGVTLFISRTVNAILAPIIGHVSDCARSRWGRRLPFMFVSALPMLAFFVLLWTPPVEDESFWNLLYLAVVLVLYNVTYSLNQIPYTALLPELARTDHHRVRISAWSSSFLLIGIIASSLAGPLIERTGYAMTALIYASGVLPLFYLPFLALSERPGRRVPAVERPDLSRSIATMLRNRPFLIMTATGIFYWGITALIQAAIPYVVTEICQLRPEDALLFYVPGVLASLLCYPMITWLAARAGKCVVFAGSLLVSAIVLPGLMLIGPWIPISLKAQGIAWVTLQAVALSGVLMLPPAFAAEITDYDERLSGQRREGTYYAMWGLLDQVINGIVAAVLPLLLLLGRSRSDPRGPLGVRLIGVMGGLLMVIAFAIFTRYPLWRRSPAKGEQCE